MNYTSTPGFASRTGTVSIVYDWLNYETWTALSSLSVFIDMVTRHYLLTVVSIAYYMNEKQKKGEIVL